MTNYSTPQTQQFFQAEKIEFPKRAKATEWIPLLQMRQYKPHSKCKAHSLELPPPTQYRPQIHKSQRLPKETSK